MQTRPNLYKDNTIDATAIIGPHVKMGRGNWVGPYAVIQGHTVLGDNNRIEGQCSIGSPAEHRDFFWKEGFGVQIGSNNVIREWVSINEGTERVTSIGDWCVLLRGSHVGHDAILENYVNVSCSVLLGGHSHVDFGANLGLGSIVHQHCRIGAYAMLGMNTIVNKRTPILPGNIYVGSPARFLKENSVGLLRHNVSNETIEDLRREFTKSI